jgi:hypothetical protein
VTPLEANEHGVQAIRVKCSLKRDPVAAGEIARPLAGGQLRRIDVAEGDRPAVGDVHTTASLR